MNRMGEEDPSHDRLFVSWRQLLPTLVTLAAMLSGFLSILVTVQGMVGRVGTDSAGTYFQYAALLILLAMILDGLDGNIARWLKGCSAFGAELDTYVDLTAFGIAPAVLIFAVTLQHKDPTWQVLLPSCVALSGVVRLARFKVKDPLRGQGGYAGLPITANAAWVSLFAYITLAPPKEELIGPVGVFFLVGVAVFIVLQVTNVRYPKPTKKAWMFIPMIILVALLFVLPSPLDTKVAWGMLVLGLVYVIIGPFFVKGMEAHKARQQQKLQSEAQLQNAPPSNTQP